MLNYFINEMNTFSDLYKITSGMRDYHKSIVFEEMINLVFIYHPIYASLAKEYHIFKTLKPEMREHLGFDTHTDLQFIRTYEDEWCTIQTIFSSNNDRIVWKYHDSYKSDKYYKHFFITNSDIKNVLPIENVDKDKIIYISGLFFNMLKPEWFEYLRNKLHRKLYMFQPLIPSPHNIDIINDVISSYSNRCNIKILEQEFTTDFIFNHYWINREMNNKYTVVSFESFPQLLQFLNNVSYQKLVSNFTHQFLTIYNPDNFDEIYCSDGLLLLHTVEDVVGRIKILQNSKSENINLTIAITYNCTDILIESLKSLNITPNMLIAYPHMSDEVLKLFDDEIFIIDKRLLVLYPKDSQQKYTINKGSIYADSEYHHYVNSRTLNNDTQQPAKYKKTNIMDYLDAMLSEQNNENNENNKNNENNEEYEEYVDDFESKYNTLPPIDKTDWENTYLELADWTGKYGTLPIIDDTVDLTIPDNQLECTLREFMNEQLEKSKQNDLTKGQIKKLEAIRGWKELDANQKINEVWLAKYNQLYSWVLNNKEFPKQNSTNEIESIIYTFLYNQCMKLKNDNITKEKMYKLGLIRGWDKYSEKYKQHNEWVKCFNRLKNLVSITQKFPQCVMGMSYEEYELYTFIELQKLNYKFKNIPLTKIEELESIPNWSWKFATNNNICNTTWEIIYKELKIWAVKNNAIPEIGEYEIPTDEVAKLVLFIDIQRINKLFDKLNDNQIKKLEILPFWKWSLSDTIEFSMDDLWEFSFNKLQLCTILFKDFPSVDYNNNDTRDTSLFMDIQKKAYHLELLNEEQILRLEGFNFWNWNIIEKDNFKIDRKVNNVPQKIKQKNIIQDDDLEKMIEWEKKYADVLKWCEDHDYLPKRNMKDEYEKDLYYFLDKHKKYQKYANLSKYKIEKMEALPGWCWIGQKPIKNEVKVIDEWNITYIELSKWVKSNNKLPTFNATNEIEKKLFEFCNDQITNKIDGKLTLIQIQKLEILKHWTWVGEQCSRTLKRVKVPVNNPPKTTKILTKVPINDPPKTTKILTKVPVNDPPKTTKTLTKVPVNDPPKTSLTKVHVNNSPKTLTNVPVNDPPKILTKVPVNDPPKTLTKVPINKSPKTTKILTKVPVIDLPKTTKVSVINPPTTTQLWITRYDQLKEWTTKNGKLPVFGSSDKLQNMLLTFVYNNRSMYNKQKLNNEQITKLEALPNWSWTKDSK